MGCMDWIKSLFSHEQEFVIEEPKHVPLPQQINLKTALETAIAVTASFEGHNGFGNVVGNFDGQGLTCGALGFAWAQGLHQKIVLKASRINGLIKSRMPQWGQDYCVLASQSIKESLPHIVEWSDTSGKMLPTLCKELTSLWSCPEMVELQVEQAQTIGEHAYRDASGWSQQYRRLVAPTLHEFLFFFDIIVQNGSTGLDFHDVQNKIAGDLPRALYEVFEWLQFISLSDEPFLSQEDAGNNAKFWDSKKDQVTEEQRFLLILAYLRSRKADLKYQGNVLNRKGTIAMFSGYVNRQVYHLHVDYPQIEYQIVL